MPRRYRRLNFQANRWGVVEWVRELLNFGNMLCKIFVALVNPLAYLGFDSLLDIEYFSSKRRAVIDIAGDFLISMGYSCRSSPSQHLSDFSQ